MISASGLQRPARMWRGKFRHREGSMGREMFKGEVLETTVKKSKHRDSEIRTPESQGLGYHSRGQEAPVKSQG